MTRDQIIAVYNALANTGRARAIAAVAQENGVPKVEVERLVAFIKSSPLFSFEPTATGLLRNLTIRLEAPGVYSHRYTGLEDFFYKNGELVHTISDSRAYGAVSTFSMQMAADAAADGVPFYRAGQARIHALAPFLVEWLAAEPA